MVDTWLGTNTGELALIAISAVAILVWSIAVFRVIGLRSLSKMSSFDFVVTVALGSIVAGVVATPASLSHGAFAFAALLGLQWLISQLRRRAGLGAVVDNTALLLMEGEEILDDNLDRARVTADDLVAKLRGANVTRMDEVLAVVLETTGDVSVLSGDGPLDERVLQGVRRR